MAQFSKQICYHILKNEITITTEYLPGVLNTLATWRWKIESGNQSGNSFKKISQKFGKPQIDIFASRLSHQCYPITHGNQIRWIKQQMHSNRIGEHTTHRPEIPQCSNKATYLYNTLSKISLLAIRVLMECLLVLFLPKNQWPLAREGKVVMSPN